ncbi:MAG: hypothetical protein LBB37_02395 [Endomicrobium sp.]|nr:hypothetical protein [Endomicrobium sp.]
MKGLFVKGDIGYNAYFSSNLKKAILMMKKLNCPLKIKEAYIMLLEQDMNSPLAWSLI